MEDAHYTSVYVPAPIVHYEQGSSHEAAKSFNIRRVKEIFINHFPINDPNPSI